MSVELGEGRLSKVQATWCHWPSLTGVPPMVFPNPTSIRSVPLGSVVFWMRNDHLLPEGKSPHETIPIDLPVSAVFTQADTVRGFVPTMPLKPLITTSFATPSNCSALLNFPVTHWAGSFVNPISVAVSPPPASSVVRPEVWLKGNQ